MSILIFIIIIIGVIMAFGGMAFFMVNMFISKSDNLFSEDKTFKRAGIAMAIIIIGFMLIVIGGVGGIFIFGSNFLNIIKEIFPQFKLK